MQSDWKQIYKLTAERTGKDEQRYKDIGNFVFHELYQNLRRPKSLIIKLRGVGQWYLRRKRMQILVDIFPPDYEKVAKHPLEAIKLENKREIFEIFKERLKEYDEFLQIKAEVRKKRNESQTLLQPRDREAESSQPSQDNPE